MSIQEKIQRKQVRLDLYLEKEKQMLTDGVQAYGLGSRSVTRYSVDLANIRAEIKALETEIEELCKQSNGRKPRKAFGVVPRDF